MQLQLLFICEVADPCLFFWSDRLPSRLGAELCFCSFSVQHKGTEES